MTTDRQQQRGEGGRVVKGERFLAYGGLRPANRLFIEVKRVARDGTWADIFVCNWAVAWTKRQPLEDGQLPYADPYDWTQRDLDSQMADWQKARDEMPAPTQGDPR